MTLHYQVEGNNNAAHFTLKIHRGDGMALLAMNWRNGKPPADFVGFSIEYREPGGDRFWPLKNRIGFPGQKPDKHGRFASTVAPFQKFRWVHFPNNAELPGAFSYRVTPLFMDSGGGLSQGLAQEASLALMRQTIPDKLNVAYTRGFVSSQAFVGRFEPDGKLSTLIPTAKNDGLTFKATHKRAAEAHDWMGFEARSAIHEVLDAAIAKASEVRVIAYDLNLPEIVNRLEKLGPRLKIIIDDSKGEGGGHASPDSAESKSAKRLRKSAGPTHVVRQNMDKLQHHKSIAVKGGGLNLLVYGSTNFTWRGFYVQNNNAVVVNSTAAVDDYFDAFDTYFAAKDADDFRDSSWAKGWHDLKIPAVSAKASFSPHDKSKGLLKEIADDIDSASSSVFFSLAFLGQMTKGNIGPALGRALHKKNVHVLGISDKDVGADNLGVEVLSPDRKRRVVSPAALSGKLPQPFKAEPSGLTNGVGTRMHHKFVVLDFNTADARVYLGSYNFSEDADWNNGENLLLVKDRTVATSYMIEALRIYDHYRFRTAAKKTKSGTKKVMTLQTPPKTKTGKAWWLRDWDDKIRARDRELFA